MLLLDNSAWSRIVQEVLDDARTETVAGWIERQYLGTCLPFLLEAGFSARSAGDHRATMVKLQVLPHVQVTPGIERRALQAQRELSLVGHHRIAPIDVFIAACAHEAGAGVLHYDRDYDLIAEHTSLEFESEWVAPAGTL